jgi:hypothetical protein
LSGKFKTYARAIEAPTRLICRTPAAAHRFNILHRNTGDVLARSPCGKVFKRDTALFHALKHYIIVNSEVIFPVQDKQATRCARCHADRQTPDHAAYLNDSTSPDQKQQLIALCPGPPASRNTASGSLFLSCEGNTT